MINTIDIDKVCELNDLGKKIEFNNDRHIHHIYEKSVFRKKNHINIFAMIFDFIFVVVNGLTKR